MVLDEAMKSFHPAVKAWFDKAIGVPTEPQSIGWPLIREGKPTLISAPTGSGKTLSAFLVAIDKLVTKSLAQGGLENRVEVLYVSPLRALSNDIERNLQAPLAGIEAQLADMGFGHAGIRSAVRTGDTSNAERTAITKKPPHILVTTPESLYALLTSEGGRRTLRHTRTVIVDEIHALIRDKRGSHLSLSLERLDALTESKVQRIGLSATQKPLSEVGRFLTGGSACEIVDIGHGRPRDLAIEVPGSPLETVMSGEVWNEVYERLVALIESHESTLVFVNTRRLAERLTRALTDRLGEANITTHHGSMAKERRFNAEQRLKAGNIKALVATASLELGIDIGAVDLVCQIGSPRAIHTFLQRVGRSGHQVGATPKGRLFPLSRDELVECVALIQAVNEGKLETIEMPQKPVDILAQQIVASVASTAKRNVTEDEQAQEGWSEDTLFEMVKGAYPYRGITRSEFDDVVKMLAEGFSTQRGRSGAHLHRDGVNKVLRARKGARLAALTSGGAIPDNADYEVVLEPENLRVGTVNEDFAIESSPGDIFQLGNTSWRILRVEPGKLRVADARGQPPTIPFWLGEAPGRSIELSSALADLRAAFDDNNVAHDASSRADLSAFGESISRQLSEYMACARAALGAMPTQTHLVAERFFDEAGNQHVVIHSPFGERLNRAWGLALRKRFCRSFNFELQAAALGDAIVLSLGPTHSFPLQDVFKFLHSATVRSVLIQALLDAPMFATRWRWNASRALAILRWRSGKKRPPALLRMEAEDLVATVFPDSLACLENIQGDREVPDHPLVQETISDCLHEAMDIDALETLLRGIESGAIKTTVKDLTEPSPLAHQILAARPYAFLDDAPLEERRTQAVLSRRWLRPEDAQDLGSLSPDAIAEVRKEAWPQPRDVDEMHDSLVVYGFWTESEMASRASYSAWRDTLVESKRLTHLATDEGAIWVAAERLHEWSAIFPYATLSPTIVAVEALASPEAACKELVRARLQGTGPVTVKELHRDMLIPIDAIGAALAALENEGSVMRGQFTSGNTEEEWCERRLLARIHRYTLQKLRREIEPVSTATLTRFLLDWQHVRDDSQLQGPHGVRAVLEQLEGFEAPAAAWESDILPSRIKDYDPSWLDQCCASGSFTWVRRSASTSAGSSGTSSSSTGPIRTTPIAWVRRSQIASWKSVTEAPSSQKADAVRAALKDHGALFFGEIVEHTGLLRTEVERALSELVVLGEINSDGFTGLRALLTPENKKSGGPSQRRRVAHYNIEEAGRWSLLRVTGELDKEHIARVLLRRYGVVFRTLLDNESGLPPWRDLLMIFRRLEDRGEIRGGRFVDGQSGEQFALPEVIPLLRKLRNHSANAGLLSVTAVDPLNLTNALPTGQATAKLSRLKNNRVLYRDGAPIAFLESGDVRWLVEVQANETWPLKMALTRRGAMALPLRSYLAS